MLIIVLSLDSSTAYTGQCFALGLSNDGLGLMCGVPVWEGWVHNKRCDDKMTYIVSLVKRVEKGCILWNVI